ncbi:hypothetical protein BSAF29S_01402 [Bacillus safensis subsp. safensis]
MVYLSISSKAKIGSINSKKGVMKMTKVRVAIAGVGSCASSIVQFVELAKEKMDTLSGVMHDVIGGYHLSVEFVAAFEVDQNKVGKDLSEAIFTKPTAAVKHIDVPFFQVPVEAGPLCDGLEGDLSNCIQPHEHSLKMNTHDVTQRLKDVQADVRAALYRLVRLKQFEYTQRRVHTRKLPLLMRHLNQWQMH